MCNEKIPLFKFSKSVLYSSTMNLAVKQIAMYRFPVSCKTVLQSSNNFTFWKVSWKYFFELRNFLKNVLQSL